MDCNFEQQIHLIMKVCTTITILEVFLANCKQVNDRFSPVNLFIDLTYDL